MERRSPKPPVGQRARRASPLARPRFPHRPVDLPFAGLWAVPARERWSVAAAAKALTPWVGSDGEPGYDANMRTASEKLSELIDSASDQFVGALHCAVGAGLDTGELTDLL